MGKLAQNGHILAIREKNELEAHKMAPIAAAMWLLWVQCGCYGGVLGRNEPILGCFRAVLGPIGAHLGPF